MRKNLTILCGEDEQQRHKKLSRTSKNQKTNISPFSKTYKNHSFMSSTTCQTPQEKNNPKEQYEFRSPKYIGIIEKNVLQRLQFYQQKNKQKRYFDHVSTKMKEEQIAVRQLKQKPQINQTSKQLFQKIKNQRKLSPNILQRFQTYECERVQRKAKCNFLKSQGIQIKSTTSTCKRNMENKSKSKTPLKECQINQNRSRSKSATNFSKTLRNPSDIGKIVQRMQTTNYKSKKQAHCRTVLPGQVYCHDLQNLPPTLKKQFSTNKSQIVQKKYIRADDRFHSDKTNAQQLTPISMKKTNQNSKKWKVII